MTALEPGARSTWPKWRAHLGRFLSAAVAAGLPSFSPLLTTSASGASEPSAPIAWAPCPQASGYLCGTLKVPLDYAHPSRGSVPLAVMEHPAPQSKGVVVFNPGGPGESGVLILPILASLVPASVSQQFTLVSFDERGTGSSEPLRCGPSAVAASSAVAGSVSARRTFAGLERRVAARYPALFPTVTTTTSARDMDRVRIALGVGRIDYYGLSYGTVLGSVYASSSRAMSVLWCSTAPLTPT